MITVRKIPHRNMALVLAASLLSGLGTSSAPSAEVPAQYRGLWCFRDIKNVKDSTPLYRCRKANDESYQYVGRDSIKVDEEGGCPIAAVRPTAKGHRLTLDCPPDRVPKVSAKYIDLWLDRRGRLHSEWQPDTLPKLPEGIDIAWRCDGMIIAIVETQLKGVSRGGTYIADDVETTIWIYNPLRLPLPTTFMFKQYETAHPYSTWSAELVGGQCQEVFFGGALEDRLPERMRNLANIVRLEKSDEFKRCLKKNPDEHQMCRDVAEQKLKTNRAHESRSVRR
jgi:hypothetical protein